MRIFEVRRTCPTTQARLGRMVTSRGVVVETPVFMPVGTQGTVKAMTQQELWEMGYRLITTRGTGRAMMCSTAGLQVNLPLGGPDRWRLAHDLGPVLAAAFANSPFACGRPSGYRSTRLAVWAGIG